LNYRCVYTSISVGVEEMKTISVITRKGGSGKTTLSACLSVAAVQSGLMTVALDLDPQASLCLWSDLRDDEQPPIIPVPASRLKHVLEGAEKEGCALAIIDTMPHAESSILAAARVADLCLIPVRASVLDLGAIAQTVDICKLAGVPHVAVINAVKSRALLQEAKQAITSLGLELCPVPVWDRTDYPRAMGAGLTPTEYAPEDKAASEIARLYKWIFQRL
jgi:chromosome partitioning protein